MKTNIFPANSASRSAFGATAQSGIPSLTARPAAQLASRRKPSTPIASALLAAGMLFCLTALPGRAADGDLDLGFNPNVNAVVYCAAEQADGKILLGGGFTSVDGTARNRVARLTADGILDPGFNPNVDRHVYSMAVQADGKILLGGYFTSVGGVGRNYIARLNIDGTLDAGFNPDANGVVHSVVLQANGKVLVVGKFTAVGGVARNRIARLNADGTVDTGFNPDADEGVNSVVVQPDGQILLGGWFTSVGGQTRNCIARVNANGTLDAGFNPNAGGLVASIAVQTDGKILLGGWFTTVGGTARNRIARLHADGTLDTTFNPNASSGVQSLALQADGKILLGGYFYYFYGTSKYYPHIARLNPNGTLDTGFDPPEPSYYVESVVVQTNGRILLGGSFSDVGGTVRNYIARLLNGPATQTLVVPDVSQAQWLRSGTAPEVEQVTFELSVNGGSSWTALGSGTRVSGGWTRTGLNLPASGSIRARGRATGGYMSGSSSLIEQVSSHALHEIAVLVDGTDLVDGVGTVEFGIVPPGQTGLTKTFTVTNAGAGNLTLGTVTLSDSAAGDYLLDTSGMAGMLAEDESTTFTVTFRPTAHDLRRATLHIATNDGDESPFDVTLSGTQVRADGDFDSSTNGTVYGMAVQPDGKMMLGGNFTSVCGVPRNHIARLHADGTLDTAFDPNANGIVFSLALQADGRILVGGWFTTLGGTACTGFGRLNANGTLDTAFNPNVGGSVASVMVQADGKVLIGGGFTTVGGLERNHLARIHIDGTLDTAFNANVYAYGDSAVSSVAVQPDGKILLAGTFRKVGGIVRNYIARVHADGTLDTDFNPNPGGHVRCLTVQPDGKILLGGNFTSLGGGDYSRWRIARLHADGTVDMGFDPDVNGIVFSMAMQTDGKILIAGSFTQVDQFSRHHIARLNSNGTLDPSFNPDADNDVTSVLVQDDGRILVGGGFHQRGRRGRRPDCPVVE
jgi:uncharacterized delta-60 repeat protein